MMGKTADKTSLRKRAAALLAVAALASALGFGAAFAGDEAGGALEVNDLGVVQADGVVSDDAAAAGKADVAATGVSTGSAAVADSVAAEEAATADAGSNAAAEELPLPDDCGGAYLKGAVAFTNVAPLVGSSSAEPADDGQDGNVAAYAAAGFAAVADDLLAAFAGDAGVATLEEDAPEDGGDGSDADSGLVLDKTAKANENGTYTITLEAYATGEQTTVSHYDPADIVLVLDTSASMWYPMDYADGDLTAVYGSTSNQNKDGKGNNATNAYAVTDHDSTDTVSCKYTYYIKINDEYVQLKYYQNDSTHNYGSNQGWGYKDPSTGKWKYNAAVPKTSATDNNSNHVQFYKLDMSKTRLATLKTAVNSFISNVLETSPESSIAIVPFGGSVGTTTAFTSNETTLTNAVNALTATGATNSGAAMTTAASMINSLDSSHSDHKKVVVMFTDGAPTTSSAFDSDVANTAISQSKTMKGNGVTVYAVGVVDGANGALSSMGTSDINTYMHSVSSNYPKASSMTSSGEVNVGLKEGESYYLTATNSSELQKIFVKISQQVGGADNTTLDSSTVIKDIISPQFTVPENTSDIKLYTADCTGTGLTFGQCTEVTGVTATITKDTLDVTGFDFAASWCGSHSGTYGGKKLIVEFTVSPKEGFLGGNNVPTNGAASGVYVGGESVANFDVPTVNVPIGDITIEAADKNVYLTQIPADEQLKSDVTVKCGDVDITDPSKLQDWQTAYVTVESSFSTSDGFDATADGFYTVAASVKPNVAGYSDKPGTVATDQAESETKTINVFKPELTFKDSEVWYGDAAPTYYSVNKTEEVWKHGETLSTAVIMLGDKPTLGLKYAPNADQLKTEGGVKYVDSKQDIPVDVTVKIGTTDVTDKTRFVHAKCSEAEDDPVDGKFWLHVNTCSLTIEKKAASGTTFADDEYFVFDVGKDGEPYTQATVEGAGSVTITGLPVGTYAVSEDAAAAWRYTSSFDNDSVTLGNGNPCATVTCTNTLRDGRWLNALSSVVNTYGVFNGKSGAESLLAALLG